jgi:NTP pyrophosphatase (non-canonical NTP hydrolase)
VCVKCREEHEARDMRLRLFATTARISSLLLESAALATEVQQLRDQLQAVGVEREEPQRRWRPEVVAFADAMERELRANDHKGGWRDDHHDDLMSRLSDELLELQQALDLSRGKSAAYYPNNPNGPTWQSVVLSEAADVANFAMMIADVCEALHYREHGPDKEPRG